VLIPADVTGEQKRKPTTNHLIAFAGDGRESHWCFVTDRADKDGECPIISHHVDEAKGTRFIDSGDEISPVEVAYRGFSEWREAWAARLIQLDAEQLAELL
jgi:hypothetical protein